MTWSFRGTWWGAIPSIPCAVGFRAPRSGAEKVQNVRADEVLGVYFALIPVAGFDVVASDALTYPSLPLSAGR
jgi:hypothetical protein